MRLINTNFVNEKIVEKFGIWGMKKRRWKIVHFSGFVKKIRKPIKISEISGIPQISRKNDPLLLLPKTNSAYIF